MDEIDTAALREYACPDEERDLAENAQLATELCTERTLVNALNRQVAAVRAALGDDDCPNGYEDGERGCDCTVCRVRAALDGAVPCMALDCGLSWPHAAADHG